MSETTAAKTSATNKEKTPWWYRLFGRLVKKNTGPASSAKEQQQRVASSNVAASATAPPPEDGNQQHQEKKKKKEENQQLQEKKKEENKQQQEKNKKEENQQQQEKNKKEENQQLQEKKKEENQQQQEKKKKRKGAFWRLCSFFGRKNRVSPIDDKDDQKDDRSLVKAEEATQQPDSSIQKNEVMESEGLKGKEDAAPKGTQPYSVRDMQVCQLGFPNPARICYMNSSLQSLLTLTDFIVDVSSQEEVWSLSPDAEMMSCFMDIVRCRSSGDVRHKSQALYAFKKAISVEAPEFEDNGQKGAHEFLTAFVEQMRSLASPLHQIAAFMGTTYTCPVESNLVFRMQNTRTCKSCSAQSIREEEFTNLSLDLLPGGSVQQMLQKYQMEIQLEYSCECGGNTSSQQSTFLTLPKFLVLHLKRYRFCHYLQMVKKNNPIDLIRELIVTSSQAEGWYSLVSVISHLGSGGNSGHYISDGVHPGKGMDDPADCWLHYNDSHVTETKGSFVCQQRRKTAYILFYQKRM